MRLKIEDGNGPLGILIQYLEETPDHVHDFCISTNIFRTNILSSCFLQIPLEVLQEFSNNVHVVSIKIQNTTAVFTHKVTADSVYLAIRMDINASEPPPASTAVPRFTIELEFVSCLANPMYLQYLGTNFHHLLNPPETSDGKEPDEDCDAYKFARYLKYLLYWKTPEYSRFLTHPAATIRNLELLQIQSFRSSVQHPDLTARLAEGFAGTQIYEAPKPVLQDENAAEGQPGSSAGAVINGGGITGGVE